MRELIPDNYKVDVEKLEKEINDKCVKAQEKGLFVHSVIMHPETIRDIMVSDDMYERFKYTHIPTINNGLLIPVKLQGDTDIMKREYEILVRFDE